MAKDSPKKGDVRGHPEETGGMGKGSRLAFWLFGLSGMAALIYEVVWTRALSLVLGSTTYALSTMLASFMAGLSIGAFVGGIMADRSKRPAVLFAYLEAGIAVSALLVIPLINILPPLYAKMFYAFHQSFSSFSFVQFALCFMIMLIPTTLMGATFPVVCKINFVDGKSVGKDTGGVYAINTVGAIAGALIAGFVLIPGIGVSKTNLFAAGINISIALSLLFLYASGVERLKKAAKVVGLFIGALLFSSILSLGEAHSFGFYSVWKFENYDGYEEFLREISASKKLFEKENIQGNVKVYDLPERRAIFVNNRAESETMKDMTNISLLAYLPASLRPDAKSFLNIGLGTGSTLYFASTLPNLEEIHNVEINPAVEEAVRLFFYPRLFEGRRIKFITADARNYLALVNKKYDIISSEPSYPVDQGFSHLFSKEFFELVRNRLNQNGVFCQWVPTYLFNEDQMAMILKTFTTVFPNTTVWGVQDVEILFLGVAGDARQPTDDMKKRIDGRLKEQGIEPDYSLYVKSDEIEAATSGYAGQLNTDDTPLLEFYAARNMLMR